MFGEAAAVFTCPGAMIYAASASPLDVKYGNKEVFINFPLAGPRQHQHQAAPLPGDHMMGTHSVEEGPSLDTTHARST